MDRTSRWPLLVAIALGVDLALLLVLSFDELADLLSGRLSASAMTSLIGLAWSIVVGVGAVSLVRALTRSRAALSRREEVLSATALTAHDWLWEIDLDDRFTFSNASVRDLLGYRPEELLRTSAMELLYDDASREEVRRIKAEGPLPWQQNELAWRHRDGHPVWLTGRAVPLHDERGRTVGYRGARQEVSPHAEVSRTSVARQRVTQLLKTGAVSVALQPIVDVNTGEMVGAEALARFEDGRSPDLWFRDADDCGLTRRLDELCFLSALPMLSVLPQPVYLSVNANPELLLDPNFRHQLQSLLKSNGTSLDRLVVEITEHARVGNYDDLNTAIADMRAHGARFAIDDTGAGYASLNHVLRLKPDIIKLDRELITHLNEDRARRALVTALVLLALEVGASVTGEGVETADQLDTLATLGVDHAQGYLLAIPTTDPSAWEEWTHRKWSSDPHHPVA